MFASVLGQKGTAEGRESRPCEWSTARCTDGGKAGRVCQMWGLEGTEALDFAMGHPVASFLLHWQALYVSLDFRSILGLICR